MAETTTPRSGIRAPNTRSGLRKPNGHASDASSQPTTPLFSTMKRVSSESLRSDATGMSVGNGAGPANLQVFEHVWAIDYSKSGTVRFVGETEFKEGVWVGIEVDAQYEGKNDGSVAGKRYFTCAPNKGVFLHISKVTRDAPPSLPDSPTRSLNGSAALLDLSALIQQQQLLQQQVQQQQQQQQDEQEQENDSNQQHQQQQQQQQQSARPPQHQAVEATMRSSTVSSLNGDTPSPEGEELVEQLRNDLASAKVCACVVLCCVCVRARVCVCVCVCVCGFEKRRVGC